MKHPLFALSTMSRESLPQFHSSASISDRANVFALKFRSGFYDTLGSGFGTGRANLLAAFALFDDDPSKINQILDRMSEVTPERIRSVAQEYLRPSNRTVVFLEPGAAEGGRP